MKELWLNFKDENGEAKRILVEGEKFTIGRTPDNDLQIPLSNLSRQHVKIERFADVFIISDCGSSNGSNLNNEPLESPGGLKNGDKLNLGEVVEIEVEITSDEDEAIDEVSPAPNLDDDEAVESPASTNSSASAKSASASTSSGGGSSLLWLLMLAPILMVLVLLGLGGAILIARNGGTTEVVKNDSDFNPPNGNDDFPENDNKKTPEKGENPTPTATPVSNTNGNSTPINSSPVTPTPGPTAETTVTSKPSGETEKIKVASAEFLRRIAFNDPRIFLLDKQTVVLNGKINQFKGSGGLAENIRNAKKNASQITEMAKSKNLKPLFLANAALTKLGNQRGDVVATAQSMLEVLDNLSRVLGNELADDNLLVIAIYERGSAEGLQNKLAGLTKKFPNERPQTIRTIWFLKENGELSNPEFDFALQFLAIGTITQNPKDFNVSAEALVF